MDMMAKGRICAAIAALCMTVAGGFAFADHKLYMAGEQGFSSLKLFRAVSPDGKNEIRLETGDGGMKYSVLRGGKTLVEPTEFSIHVDGRGSLNGAGAQAKATMRKVEGALSTPLYKKSSIDLAANNLRDPAFIPWHKR